MPESKALRVYKKRVTEQYIVDQVNYHYDSESFRDHKDRMERGDSLYRGNLRGLFPDETALPDISLVENKFKNALHDISRLSSEGRGAVKFIPRGDKDRDMKGARIRESITEGYWVTNRMRGRERQLYLDLAGSGMTALAGYYNGLSPYPQLKRLDPRFCWPDVANGELQDMLYVQQVKLRSLARMYPDLNIDDSGDNSDDGMLVAYYDKEGVTEAIVTSRNEKPYEAKIQQQWVHELDCVPVAFEMLDTYDGAFHGLFEQLAGPLMVRNKLVRFVVDEAEQISHAPIRAKNVENADDVPGPDVIYRIDPNANDWVLDRLPPSAPASAVWQMLAYMGDQEEKESIQPPARAGNVSQSIASGSFVDRTQGQLTSVVKELQDKMASLREQTNYICMKIDEKWMDESKPLIRSVNDKKEYTPSKDIAGWYLHEVKFGAGAGLDRLNADTRVLQHLSARLISREEARAEIDYLDDSASSQDKIDRENLADALLQRFVADPTTPMSAVAKTWLVMKKEGKSLEEALEQTVPDILAAEERAQQAAGGPPSPEGLAPEGAPAAPAEAIEPRLPYPPLQQVLVRGGGG